MNFIVKAKLARNFLFLVSDPTRTDKIFDLLELIMENANDEQIADFTKRFEIHPEFMRQWKEDYDPPHPTIEDLARHPEGTFGHALHEHLTKYDLDLEFYPKMKKEKLVEYISHRLAQDHDYWHVLLGKTIDVEDELSVQAFGVAQFGSGLGMLICAGGLLHLFGKDPLRAIDGFDKIVEGYNAGKRAKFFPEFKVREHLHRPLADIRRELNLEMPSEARLQAKDSLLRSLSPGHH